MPLLKGLDVLGDIEDLYKFNRFSINKKIYICLIFWRIGNYPFVACQRRIPSTWSLESYIMRDDLCRPWCIAMREFFKYRVYVEWLQWPLIETKLCAHKSFVLRMCSGRISLESSLVLHQMSILLYININSKAYMCRSYSVISLAFNVVHMLCVIIRSVG